MVTELSLGAWSAWVEVEDQPLEVYSVQVKPELNKVIAYIEAKDDKPFIVHARWDGPHEGVQPTDMSVEVGLDGRCMLGRTVKKKALVAPGGVHTVTFRGRPTGGGMRKPFLFGQPVLTEDADEACSDEQVIKNLGTVQLKVFRCNRQTHLPRQHPVWNDVENPILNEKSKKAALSHTAHLGAAMEDPKDRSKGTTPVKYIDQRSAPHRTFEFRYLSRALPKAPSPTPPPASDRKGKKRALETITIDSDDSDVDDSEERRLRARLAELERAKVKKEKGAVKKEKGVKKEGVIQGSASSSTPSRTGLTPSQLDARVAKGADILGIYEPCPPTSRACEWNALLPDETRLIDLSVPGTHDTATWNYTQEKQVELSVYTGPLPPAAFYRCQDTSIFDSLNLGFRAFDLRYAYLPDNKTLGFYHADALMSANTTIQDVFYGFYKWLDDHPSETLFVSMQVSSGINDARFQQLTYEALNSPVALKYWIQTNGTLGTLGEARGMINLFARFDWNDLPSEFSNRFGLHFSPSLWTDNGANFTLEYNEAQGSLAYIEDLYDLTVGGPIALLPKVEQKYNTTTYHTDLAASRLHPDSLFISFASAEGDLNGDVPRDIALGNPTDGNVGVNQKLLPYFEKNRGRRHGVVFFDWYTQVEGLIDAFLDL
ncbi:hypothetical protein RQP46_006337 [Phenoliferia psychrophenolica]